jgi:cytochrome c55X
MMRAIWFTLSMVLATSLMADAPISGTRQQELLNFLKQDCGSCHGLTMKGGLGPALLPETLKGKPVEYLVTTILDGRPGTAMPAWRPLLSPAEAHWIADALLQGEQ